MYRPAWRISQTGVRSVTSPRAERMRMSRSPALLFAEVVAAVVEEDASSVTVDFRRDDVEIGACCDDGMKATADERRVAVINFPKYIFALCFFKGL